MHGSDPIAIFEKKNNEPQKKHQMPFLHDALNRTRNKKNSEQ